MKYLLPLIFIFQCSISQTKLERETIQRATNQFESLKLTNELASQQVNDRIVISQFLKNNPQLSKEVNLQRIIDGVPFFYREDNNILSVQTLRANALYSSGNLGLSLTGIGITIGIWDGGKIRNTHVEFSGNRVVFGDAAANLSTHSTHVLGTIIAQGISPLRKGFAYEANAIAYEFNGDVPEINTFASQGYLVSNHSYGNIAAQLTEGFFGLYNSQSVDADRIMFTYPFFQMVKSAGNDRNDQTISQVLNKGGYDLLTGAANSKNVITVAAVEGLMSNGDDNTFVMSNFSNFGPTDDGRIKPDLSAKGVGVSSPISISDNAYSELQGTSMAAPSITGLIALLQKHYNNINTGNFMRAATVKGLLIHSARESGDFPGPDYSFGWGVPDASKSAQIISNSNISTILIENVLNNQQFFSKSFSISNTQDINVVLSWTDLQSTADSSTNIDNRTPKLINNLDLKILKDGNIYYPWKLDVEDPTAAATNNSDNDVDNIEKVEIPNAPPGVYTIQVTHKGSLVGGLQNFSLIGSSSVGLTLNNDDYEFDNSVFIYPNPANNFLNYDIKNNAELSSINIYDISGKQVFKTNNIIENQSIDISSLSSGVYFITFISDKNSVTKKFIKE